MCHRFPFFTGRRRTPSSPIPRPLPSGRAPPKRSLGFCLFKGLRHRDIATSVRPDQDDCLFQAVVAGMIEPPVLRRITVADVPIAGLLPLIAALRIRAKNTHQYADEGDHYSRQHILFPVSLRSGQTAPCP